MVSSILCTRHRVTDAHQAQCHLLIPAFAVPGRRPVIRISHGQSNPQARHTCAYQKLSPWTAAAGSRRGTGVPVAEAKVFEW